MKFYLFAKQNDFTKEQIEKLKVSGEIFFVTETDLPKLYRDKEEKIVALDPDLLDWKFNNETIAKIPNIKAICLETTGFEWVDGFFCKEIPIISKRR